MGHTHIHRHTHTHTHKYAHARTNTHTHTHTGRQVCTRTHKRTHPHTHGNAHIWTNTYADTHICTRTYAHTHTGSSLHIENMLCLPKRPGRGAEPSAMPGVMGADPGSVNIKAPVERSLIILRGGGRCNLSPYVIAKSRLNGAENVSRRFDFKRSIWHVTF